MTHPDHVGWVCYKTWGKYVKVIMHKVHLELMAGFLLLLLVGFLLLLLVGFLLLLLVMIAWSIYLFVRGKQPPYICNCCWEIVRDCDYEEHIGRICSDLPMKSVFECGECIARKMMRHHCQYQCKNSRGMLLHQEHKFVINCDPIEEKDK